VTCPVQVSDKPSSGFTTLSNGSAVRRRTITFPTSRMKRPACGEGYRPSSRGGSVGEGGMLGEHKLSDRLYQEL
jgi:hypothetical protein